MKCSPEGMVLRRFPQLPPLVQLPAAVGSHCHRVVDETLGRIGVREVLIGVCAYAKLDAVSAHRIEEISRSGEKLFL